MDPTPTPATLSRDKRSRNGCLTCRRRKKRCDELRPVCESCTRLSLKCDYPPPGMERKNRKRSLQQKMKNENLQEWDTDSRSQSVEPATEDNGPPGARKLSLDNDGAFLADEDLMNSIGIIGVEQEHELDQIKVEDIPAVAVDDHGHIMAPLPDISGPDPQFHAFHAHNFPPYVLQDDVVDVAAVGDSDALVPLDVSSLIRTPSPFEIAPQMNFQQSLFTGLNQNESHLMQYYEEKLSRMICVAPEQDNHFVQVFLPMAHYNPADLHSIVAWSAFHSGNSALEDTGNSSLDKAVTLAKTQIMSNTFDHSTIAALLLCCSAEVCKGDLKNWKRFLNMSAAIIRNYGGLSKFLTDKNLRWIATNFAYHDLVATSSHHRGPLFNRAEYEQLLQGGQGVDPLLGICREPYQMIAEISQLANELRGMEGMTSTLTTEASILEAAQNLEHQIRSLAPNMADILTLETDECQLHRHLFEIYQLTALIHLKRSIFKLPSASLELRVWGRKLSCLLDLVLDSRVEGNLCFPMFIAGLNILPSKRQQYLTKFRDFARRNMAQNLLNSIATVEKCWARDEGGEKYVDYYVVLKQNDWDICLA